MSGPDNPDRCWRCNGHIDDKGGGGCYHCGRPICEQCAAIGCCGERPAIFGEMEDRPETDGADADDTEWDMFDFDF